MKLIVGLGNPGRKYAGTRHNVGFMAVDRLAGLWGVTEGTYNSRFEAIVGEAQPRDERVLLLKPQTFMNLSGQSVLAAKTFYKVDAAEVLVVYDELDLPPGQLRIRGQGSAGGHNGLSDIIRRLGTNEIARIRIGIGKVPSRATVAYVLGKLSPSEQAEFEPVLQEAAEAAACWCLEGLDTAMNRYNRRRKPGNDETEGEHS